MKRIVTWRTLARSIVTLTIAPLLLVGCGGSASSRTSSSDGPAGIKWLGPAKPVPGTAERVVGNGPRGAVVLWRPGHEPSTDVVVLLHGFYPLAPGFYADWIRHLVRRGSTVIYPAYEEVGGDPADFLADASSGIATALAGLPGRPRSLILIGYSSGGALAFDYTADRGEGAPVPAAVAAVDPAKHLPTGDIPQSDLSLIPPSTSVLVMASSEGASEARGLLAAARRVPVRNREFQPFPLEGNEVAMRDGAAVRRALWLPIDRLIATARAPN